MTYPKELKYTKEHEWVRIEGTKAVVGVTQYALDQLGDVVYLELPKVGSTFKAGEVFGTIESTKTVSDLYVPVSGRVTEINAVAVETPEGIAEGVYTSGWLIQFEGIEVPNNLMSAAEYEAYVSA
jgi:glycine cleavage system H protein